MAISFNEFIKQSGGTIKDVQILDKNNIVNPQQKQETFWGGKTGQEFISQPKIKQYAQAFIATLPKDIYDFAIKTPVEFGKSVAEAIPTLLSGGKKVPDYGGYVSESKKALEEGAKPFGWQAMVKPSLKTAGAGLTTIVEAKAAANLIKSGTKAVVNSISVTGRASKELGKSSYGITITPEEKTSKAVINYQAKYKNSFDRIKATLTGKELPGKPITEAETAARVGLGGTEKELAVQSKRIQNDLWKNTIVPQLEAQKKVVNMPTFFSELKKSIETTPGLGERTDLLKAYNKLYDEYKNVGTIGLEKLQDYKVDWTRLLPEKVYRGEPIASAYRSVQNMAATKARYIISNYLSPEAQQAYIDYGNLQSVIEAGQKSARDPAKLSFFRTVWQLVMDKAVTPVVTIGGKVLYRTGEGLEFIGNAGARNVGDIIEVINKII